MSKFALVFVLFFAALSATFGQGQPSNTVNFQGVTPPLAPTIGVLTPKSGYVGAAAIVTFTGTNFASNCTASFNGVSVPFTFVSATAGSIAVPAGSTIVGNNPIIVSCPMPVLTLNSPMQLPNAPVIGQPYSADLAAISKAKCPSGKCSFSLTSGPTWLSLSANGAVTGTPSGVGSYSLTFDVTDAAMGQRKNENAVMLANFRASDRLFNRTRH